MFYQGGLLQRGHPMLLRDASHHCSPLNAGEDADEEAAEEGPSGAIKAAEMRALLEALPTCVTREQCDMVSTNLVLFHSKLARKRMVRGACRGCASSNRRTSMGPPWELADL